MADMLGEVVGWSSVSWRDGGVVCAFVWPYSRTEIDALRVLRTWLW
jgi:hypothetical protein